MHVTSSGTIVGTDLALQSLHGGGFLKLISVSVSILTYAGMKTGFHGEGDLSPRGKIIAACFGHINTCLIAAAVIILWHYLDLSPLLFLDLSILLEMDISTLLIQTY